jgi:hypothetical protein
VPFLQQHQQQEPATQQQVAAELCPQAEEHVQSQPEPPADLQLDQQHLLVQEQHQDKGVAQEAPQEVEGEGPAPLANPR